MINNVFITDYQKASSKSFLRKNEINCVISILDPDLLNPFYELYTYSLRIPWHYFIFYDVEFEDFDGPKCERGDVERMMGLFEGMIKSNGQLNLLLHCTAGVCRSTAAGFLLLYMMTGDKDEALRRLLEVRNIAVPNLRIIDLYDQIKGTQLMPFLLNWRNKYEIQVFK